MRWIGMLLLTLAVNVGAFYRLPIEEDVVASIERSRPDEADLFRQLNKLGLFQNRLFIKVEHPDRLKELTAALPGFGYEIISTTSGPGPEASTLLRLLPFLPTATQDALLDPHRIAARVEQTLQTLSLPSGTSLVRMLERDPLGIGTEWGPRSEQKGTFLIGNRSGPLDFDKVEQLYQFLRERDRDLVFLSGDFFALENRNIVQRDIALCSLVSLILGGLCFYLFSRQWRVLALLLVGTLFSTAIGLIAARAVDGVIYGLVLAFASTFFSFNNETLVHCAGLSRHPSRSALIGVASAIGTTVLGFLVLLFSSSHMARQMAVIALASLLAFIVFLLVFAKDVGELSFRPLSLRRLSWKPFPTFAACAILIGLIGMLPKPLYRTDLHDFRYTSSYLEGQLERFTAATSRFDFSGLQAIPLTDDAWALFQGLESAGALQKDGFHPLRWYRTEAEQMRQWATLKPRLDLGLNQLQKSLLDAGVRVTLPVASAETLSVPAYLKLWSEMTPVPWTLNSGGKDFLLIMTQNAHMLPEAIPLHPKSFYEWILNELAAQIGRLFLVGLALMLLYLIPWQRNAHKLALIFMPLLVACLVLQLLFLWTGRSINIVHIMGASLVIAVALDYSSILISTEHAPVDQGKVLLTGGLTLTSFGSLLLASHPLLQELGLIVFVGTGVAWVFALACCRAEDAGV